MKFGINLLRRIRKSFMLLTERKIKEAIRVAYVGVLQEIFRVLPHNGVKVVEEDWDYLFVLTGCRYDIFKEVNSIPGKLENRTSLGSSLLEWLKKNFKGYYDDIIYISGNPRISSIEFQGFKGTDHFFEVVNAWDCWNQELNTILPKNVTDVALQVMEEKHRNKRMIVHYLQPHAPWVGGTRISGKELGISFTTPIEWFRHAGEIGPWGMFGKAVELFGLNCLKKAYKDNLELVLKEVERLVVGLDGKIVVTSDHGECFGEKFIIEHPSGIHIKELVEVPWLIIEKTKKIDAEKRRTKNEHPHLH